MAQRRLTEKAAEALAASQQYVIENGFSRYEPKHSLVALLAQEGGIVPLLLTKLDIDPIEPRAMAEQFGSRVPRAIGGNSQQISPSERMPTRLPAGSRGGERTRRLRSEHRASLPRHAHAAPRGGPEQLVTKFGVTRERVLEVLKEVRGGQHVDGPNPEGTYQQDQPSK